MSDNSEEIQRLLAANHQIASIWGVADVWSVRPDLNEDQALDVLWDVSREMDTNIGINWKVIETTARRLFPEPNTAVGDVATGEGVAGD